MPNKYPLKKGWKIPKQQHCVRNWPDYNSALTQRGNIEIWLSDDAMSNWYESERVYDGTGSSKKYSDFAILTCHEIRQVYRLPLRQCQGFINSIFRLMKVDLCCPHYSCLSKRLQELNIKSPRHKNNEKKSKSISAIAIDSTGLKRFGRDEWHQERHKISAKRSWRKLHIAVDYDYFIQGAELTTRLTADETVVDDLIHQIDFEVNQITADGAYDKNHVYDSLSIKFAEADIIIPPDSDSVFNLDSI